MPAVLYSNVILITMHSYCSLRQDKSLVRVSLAMHSHLKVTSNAFCNTGHVALQNQISSQDFDDFPSTYKPPYYGNIYTLAADFP